LNGSCDSIAELAPTSRLLPGPAAAGPILAVSPKIIHNFDPSTTLTPRSAPPMPKARARWSMRLQTKVGPVSMVICCPATGSTAENERIAATTRQIVPVLKPAFNAQWSPPFSKRESAGARVIEKGVGKVGIVFCVLLVVFEVGVVFVEDHFVQG
jgi:hypothetical protein